MSNDRRLIGQIAANKRWSQCPDRSAATAAARAAADARFEREVDPDGVLAPAERARRAQSARTAHFQQLARKSAKARRDRARRGVA